MRIYFALAVLIAFLAIGGYAYKKRGDAIAAEAETARVTSQLAIAVAANEENKKAVAELQAQRAKDDTAAAELQDSLDAANNSALLLAQKIAALRNGDPDVDTFLDTPIPPAYLGVYRNP